MERRTIIKAFAIAAIAALAVGVSPTAKAADKGCSNANMFGTFAYTTTGSIVAAPLPPIVGPYAEVGTVTFDGKGTLTYTLAASQNGNPGLGTATGTYTVNPDCTGTFTQVTPRFTSHYFFVLDSSGVEFQAICQDPGAVITRIGRLQFPVSDWRSFP